MPGEDDWIKNPLSIVENIFEKFLHDGWEEKVSSYFKEKLKKKDDFNDIPSINCCPLSELSPNSLVRFRGFIQDMFDPEYYVGVFDTSDQQKERKKSFGRYKEIIELNNENEIDFSNNVMRERRIYYSVSIPGENTWVKEMYAAKCQHNHLTEGECSTSNLKRQIEEEECYTSTLKQQIEEKNEQSIDTVQIKKSRNENEPLSNECENGTITIDCLPNPENMHCIVKVYDENENFFLNDCYEFIGIYICDPQLACMVDLEERMGSTFLDEEKSFRCPPSSIIPRLHMVHAIKLVHNNPLLMLHKDMELQEIYSEASVTRNHLLTILETILLGDKLAAEYLLCFLISSIYVRKDVLVLGKFCLNLFKVPDDEEFVKNLYKIIEMLTPQSYFFPMSLSNMNTIQLIPKKDHVKNKLETGILQMSSGSFLILDETALSPGQLETQGIQNMNALRDLITWQKVAYDFKFHSVEYPADIAVLVLSEGKSILPSDCSIPLKMTATEKMDLSKSSKCDPPENVKNEIRRYLSTLKSIKLLSNKDMFKEIEDDFVESRQSDTNQMTSGEFNWLLVFARFLSFSYGEKCISKETWSHCKFLETSRKNRLANL